MRGLLPIAVLVLGALLPLQSGEVVDRIVVTVNGVPVMQSDVETAVLYEAMMEGRPAGAITSTSEKAVLERLIDQELLRQQMSARYPGPTPEEVATRIRQVRAQLPGAESEQGWRDLLAKYGLSEDEVIERVTAQMQIGRFIDQRLRATIHVDNASVQAYYNDKLIPDLRKSGIATEPPLRQVRPQIEEVLVQQRMDQELTNWLRTLRQQSRIRTMAGAKPSGVDAGSEPQQHSRLSSNTGK